MTADVKGMILAALDEAGGHKYLVQQAKANPVALMALLDKILPMQLSGAGGGPLIIEQIVNAGMAAYRKQREDEDAEPQLH